MIRVGLALLIVVFANPVQTSAVQDDQTDSSQKPPVFRTEVNFIEVDAIVVDDDGNFVGDLTQSDFEILEDGQPQEIAIFRRIDIPLELEPVAEPSIEPDIKTNEVTEDGRLFVLVLDDLHIALERSPVVKEVAREFIEKWIVQGDLVAVTHTSGRTGFSRDFTSNRQSLEVAIDGFMGRKLRSMTLERIELRRQLIDGVLPGMIAARLRVLDEEYVTQARIALAHLRSISEVLGQVRGRRKTILFISEGIDYNIQDFIESTAADTVLQQSRDTLGSAGLSNVAIYALDVRGLGASQRDIVSIGDAFMPGGNQDLEASVRNSSFPEVQDLLADVSMGSKSLSDEVRRSQDGLHLLSSETGGFAIVNTNDLGEGLRRIARDNSHFYLLGYSPAGDPSDGEFRPIEVKVNRPGVSVRTRKGYIAPERDSATSARSGGEYESLSDVLKSPLPVTGLPIRAFATPVELARGRATVPVVVETTIDGFYFAEKDGKLHDRVDISVVALNEQNEIVDRRDNKFNLGLLPEQRERMLEDGFRGMVVLELPPGAYRLRIGVYENGAGRGGSVFTDLEVPDPSRLAMSGLLICSGKENRIPIAAEKKDLERFPFSPSTRRQFSADDELLIYAEIHSANLREGVNLRTVFRDELGEIVYESEKTQDGRDASSTHFIQEGYYNLSELLPGTYSLEVTARELNGFAQAERKVLFEVIDSLTAAGAASGETVDLTDYRDIVDSYRQGRFTLAARRLSRVTWRNVRGAATDYGKQTLSDSERKAAAMLHTEAALLNRPEEPYHVKAVRDHINRINDVSTRRDFERQWILAFSQYLQKSLRYENALDMMEKALKTYPDDLELHMAIAAACEKPGWGGDDRLLDRAEKEHRRILQMDPDNVEAHLRLGRMLYVKGRTDEAVNEIEWSLSRAEDKELKLIANIILGNIHNQQGELSEEIESFRAAVEIDPRCQVAAVALSHALHRAGDLDGSREVMEQLFTQTGPASGGSDPWWRFLRSDSDRFDSMMDALREDVRPLDP